MNTGTKDGRAGKVLQEFVQAGAPGEILYAAKPHIGTDFLHGVVKNLREQIVSLGGKVQFETKLVELHKESGRMTGLTVEHGGQTERIEADQVILAIGHSARDTF